MFNASVIGNLTRDAELKQVNGTDCCEFTIAANVGYGQRKETTFVRCSLWGKRAVSLAPYLTKGLKVYATGDLKVSAYTGKNGPAASVDLRASDIELMGGSGGSDAQAVTPEVVADDDLPF